MNVIFKQLPEEVEHIAVTNNGLKQALHRLEVGTPATPRSWFYEHKSPQWVLDAVSHRLNDMKDLKTISDWDLSKSGKFAPQGESAPLKERLGTFEEYFSHLEKPQIIHDPLWKRAKFTVTRMFGFSRSGVPLSVHQVTQRGLGQDLYGTSSGYPLYIKRKNPEAIEQAETVGRDAIRMKYPFTLGTRATMGKTGTEARNIFMAPMAVNVWGQTFLYPLMDYMRYRSNHVARHKPGADYTLFVQPWEGWDNVQHYVSQFWPGLKFGADYTKMDQHFNLYHALEVFDVVKTYFSEQYWEDLYQSICYVFRAPIITNLGYVDQDHAMPSGSEWTNFLETVWNLIFVVYLQLKYHFEFKMVMGIGDDQLWIIDKMKRSDRQIQWITDTVVSEFEFAGLPGNPEKQEVSFTSTGFLQRFMTSQWDGLYGKMRAAGVYSLIRNVTSQVYPERYHNDRDWTWEMFALRVIMIAENCNQHPEFPWYVNFIAKSNDNILRFVRQGDLKVRKDWRIAKGIANFIPTYNQARQGASITDFATYKLLKEMV